MSDQQCIETESFKSGLQCRREPWPSGSHPRQEQLCRSSENLGCLGNHCKDPNSCSNLHRASSCMFFQSLSHPLQVSGHSSTCCYTSTHLEYPWIISWPFLTDLHKFPFHYFIILSSLVASCCINLHHIFAKSLIGKLPSRCQDQCLRVALRVVDALQRANHLGALHTAEIRT